MGFEPTILPHWKCGALPIPLTDALSRLIIACVTIPPHLLAKMIGFEPISRGLTDLVEFAIRAFW